MHLQPNHIMQYQIVMVVPTIDVIDSLRSEGWMPIDATQKNVRTDDKRDLTTHLIRFRRVDNQIRVGDGVVELLLKNSHDRSSAFVLHAGIFRMACANGIVIADSTFKKLSVRHGKNVVNDIIEGSYNVIRDVPMIANEVETMQNIELANPERHLLAKTAYEYANGELGDNMLSGMSNITTQLLQPLRREDTGKDLWTTFNVIQEKMLKGGIRTTKYNNETMKVRRNTSRKVKNIDKNLKLNKALWSMAMEMKALKA